MRCSFLPVLVSMCPSQMNDEVIEKNYIVYSCSLLVQKHLSFGDAHVVVDCASDSLIPKFLRVTLDTFWRAPIDLCMHGLVQPQTHLPIFRSVLFPLKVFVMSPSFRNSWWISLRKSWSRTEFHFVPEKFGNDVRNWLVQLKMTSRLTNVLAWRS